MWIAPKFPARTWKKIWSLVLVSWEVQEDQREDWLDNDTKMARRRQRRCVARGFLNECNNDEFITCIFGSKIRLVGGPQFLVGSQDYLMMSFDFLSEWFQAFFYHHFSSSSWSWIPAATPALLFWNWQKGALRQNMCCLLHLLLFWGNAHSFFSGVFFVKRRSWNIWKYWNIWILDSENKVRSRFTFFKVIHLILEFCGFLAFFCFERYFCGLELYGFMDSFFFFISFNGKFQANCMCYWYICYTKKKPGDFYESSFQHSMALGGSFWYFPSSILTTH